MRDAAQDDARIYNRIAVGFERGGDRHQCECVAGAVAHFNIIRFGGEIVFRQFDCGDKLAVLQIRVNLRRVAGQTVKFDNRNRAFLPVRILNSDNRVQSVKRIRHIARICGDAGFAPAQNGVNPVNARDGVAA